MDLRCVVLAPDTGVGEAVHPLVTYLHHVFGYGASLYLAPFNVDYRCRHTLPMQSVNSRA